MEADTFQRYIHVHIPLSRAMGTRVLEAGPGGVVLEAPLAPNVNHRATAFGGSVSALAILAGWGTVHLRLRDQGIETRTVVQRSDVSYLRPIDGAFQARAACPPPQAWDRFVKGLRRWGRGRIRIAVEVTSSSVQVATVVGDYVALLSDGE